jgi:penicillin-binding protein 1A
MRARSAPLRLIGVLAVLSLFIAGSAAALTPVVAGLADAIEVEPPSIDLEDLENYAVRSYVYADDGSLLATLFGPENRQPVELADVPDEVVAPILAVEDAEFWNHRGVNLRATARALLENVSEGEVVQGGSTITQQLVKNALLNDSPDLDRKTREAALAIELERRLDKESILETYLNTVYFGSGAYGVQAAAEIYWGKDVSELGWAEGALLAGIIVNPSRFDPTLNPDGASRQRSLALGRLVEVGELTQAEADAFDAAPLPTIRCVEGNFGTFDEACREQAFPNTGNYFVEDVRQALLDDPKFGLGDTPEQRAATLYGGGLRIDTTLDPGMQFAAEVAASEAVPPNDLGVTSAMVTVENATGAVRAMVGGPGYEEYRYNVASLDPGRQTGSSFKTFVLLSALEQGAVPLDTVAGGGSFPNPQGSPNPYNISGAGGTLTSITAGSSNGAYVRLGQIVGLENVGELAERLGMRTDFGDYPISLPLGTLLSTPLDMASAFSAIANEGLRNPWFMIKRVVGPDGEVLYEHEADPNRAITRQTACLATEALQAVVRSGTATRAQLPNQVAAGKTGTTERNADAWFVGFTPYLTTAVWMGNPDANVSMANLGGVANFGGTYPAQLWRDFNGAVHQSLEPRSFPQCDTVRRGRFINSSDDLNSSGRLSSRSREEPEDDADDDAEEDADDGATPTTRPPGSNIRVVPPTTAPPSSTTSTTAPPTSTTTTTTASTTTTTTAPVP